MTERINDMQIKSLVAYVKSCEFGKRSDELTPLAVEIANEAIKQGKLVLQDGILRVNDRP